MNTLLCSDILLKFVQFFYTKLNNVNPKTSIKMNIKCFHIKTFKLTRYKRDQTLHLFLLILKLD